MIRHIVCWKFLEQADGATKEENLRKAITMLESLRGTIPEIRSLEVGIDLTRSDASSDLVLNGTFASVAALEAYQRHPDHLAVASFLSRVRSARTVVDYEVSLP
jgi:hypothetical protein